MFGCPFFIVKNVVLGLVFYSYALKCREVTIFNAV